MKIKVKDLRPNPYRDLEKYEIDSCKVDALVTSIEETSFWDNIVVRKAGDVYQIAYGHSRLEAIKKVGLKEVDVPVRELDDAMMIKIMANENLDEWKLDPVVINESVRVARDFLWGEFKKAKELKDLPEPLLRLKVAKSGVIKKLPNDRYQQLRSSGPGQSIIQSFLGGNWKTWMVSEALLQLREPKEMQEAIEVFGTQTDAHEFRKIVKDHFKDKIPKGKEKTIAKKVAKSIEEKKEQIQKGKEERRKDGKKTDNLRGHGHRDDMKVFTRMAVENISEKEAKLKDIELEIKRFDTRIRAAVIGSIDLNQLLKELDVEQLGGIKSLFVLDNVSELLQELKKTLVYFGYDYKLLSGG